MRGTLIMALAIALIAVIFALQNSGSVNVHLGPASFSAPLALILLLTLAAGVLAGYLSLISRMFRMGSEIKKLKREMADAQQPPSDAQEAPSEPEAPSGEETSPDPDTDTEEKRSD